MPSGSSSGAGLEARQKAENYPAENGKGGHGGYYHKLCAVGMFFLKVEKIACHGKYRKCGGNERIETLSEKYYAAKAHKWYGKEIDKP